MTPPVPTSVRARDRDAFTAEERNGLRLAALVRGVTVLALLAVFLATTVLEGPSFARGVTAILGAVALAGGQLWLLASPNWRPWMKYPFAVAEVGLLVAGLIATAEDLPATTLMRDSKFVLFLVFLAPAGFATSPFYPALYGLLVAFGWGALYALALATPGAFTEVDLGDDATAADHYRAMSDVLFVSATKFLVETAAGLLIAAGLSVAVWRARRLVERRTTVERARANLARYFSPRIVDSLAARDRPLGPGRRQTVAVLFADIEGFTGLSERRPPEEILDLLRAVHGRLEAAVFESGGTLERYVGDALLATFGVPEASGPSDARDAVRCAAAMRAAMADLNATRTGAGETPLSFGIGIHYGPAVLGDIGSERSMAFTVIGDTVNVASRLEGLCRALPAATVISAATRGAVLEAGGEALLAGFVPHGPARLRGRAAPVEIWSLAP